MKNFRILFLAIAVSMVISSFAVNVTFKVDMAQQTVPPEGVHIAGSFQNWEPGATEMTLESEAVYIYSADLTAGEMLEYKFVNGDEWGEDESVPPECNQNNNRFLTVPAEDIVLEVVCFGSCAPCGNPVDLTFQVDMSEQTVSPEGVYIAGSFQGWNPASTQMNDMGDNMYAVTVTVSENDYMEFKYINGNDWPGEEIVPASCGIDNGVGGFNRFYTVPVGGAVLEDVCFSSCDPCGYVPVEVVVTFSVDMSQETVSADGVHFVSDFQEWDPAANPMTDIGDGIHEIEFTLLSGDHHQYKFINGNTWDFEEVVPEECGEDNGQGGYNRFVDVPEENLVLEDVCYGSCDPCIVGIESQTYDSQQKFIIYPNPFSNELSIQFIGEEATDIKLEIVNVFGQVVLKTGMEEIQSSFNVYTTALAEGIYFCRIKYIENERFETELIKLIKK